MLASDFEMPQRCWKPSDGMMLAKTAPDANRCVHVLPVRGPGR
jgi:hypothetical protein